MPPQKLGTRYLVHGTIGKGKFSRVRFCSTSDTNENFALRIIDKQKLEEHGLLEDMKNEITIMRMLKHENIISVRDMFASHTRVFLVLDLMVGGNLQTKIGREGPLPMRKCRFYFQQLYRGVEHLHSMGVTHGNLRLENLLLDTDGCLKISDFTFSTIFDLEPDHSTPELTSGGADKHRSLLFRRNPPLRRTRDDREQVYRRKEIGYLEHGCYFIRYGGWLHAVYKR
jgi:serine/threonine protein kinase